jgi:hypothetical protein
MASGGHRGVGFPATARLGEHDGGAGKGSGAGEEMASSGRRGEGRRWPGGRSLTARLGLGSSMTAAGLGLGA